MNGLCLFDKEFIVSGTKFICGIDEAGRGPLAGPVCAAAYIPDYKFISDGVNDSKKLSDKKRRQLLPELIENAVAHAYCFVDPGTIDLINILEATKRAMINSLSSLFPLPDIVLVDAVKLNVPNFETVSIIKGDAKSYAIAAASVIAKVKRDNYMLELAAKYPEYGFEENKGYGTARHIEMLKKYGPSPVHRKSFIKNFFKDCDNG